MNRILLDSNYYKTWKNYTHLSPISIKKYTTAFRKFEKYLVHCGYTGKLDFDNFYLYEESNVFTPIDTKFIDDYLDYLRFELNATKHMLYDNIVYLRNFFAFLKDIKMIKSNPMAHYKNHYYERKLINRSISINDCRKMLNAALTIDPFFRQDYTLLLLMMTTGLRNSEVRNLSIEQINLDRGIIIVNRGQKNSANIVYMPTSLKNELRRYLSHPMFIEWEKNGNQLVFFKDSKILSLDELNIVIKKIAQIAGITQNVTAHTFRHTTAYLMQMGNIDIAIIQKQLRHVSSATTLRYLPPVQKNNSLVDENAMNLEKKDNNM